MTSFGVSSSASICCGEVIWSPMVRVWSALWDVERSWPSWRAGRRVAGRDDGAKVNCGAQSLTSCARVLGAAGADRTVSGIVAFSAKIHIRSWQNCVYSVWRDIVCVIEVFNSLLVLFWLRECQVHNTWFTRLVIYHIVRDIWKAVARHIMLSSGISIIVGFADRSWNDMHSVLTTYSPSYMHDTLKLYISQLILALFCTRGVRRSP